ncbi:hypothetical protein [Tellurirhabdus rosea]|uniref:hypothetical protein n=1 Tax=Tellurirhabdus rosea TaxID=2674997 RepID=UPI00224D0026|nr:hypothetical protein [Tellurirhabdus rosea]
MENDFKLQLQQNIILNEILPDLAQMTYSPYREHVVYLRQWLSSPRLKHFGENSYIYRWLTQKYERAKEQMFIQEGDNLMFDPLLSAAQNGPRPENTSQTSGSLNAESDPFKRSTFGQRSKILAYIYLCECGLEQEITRINGSEYAEKFGSSSGDAIYNNFKKYAPRKERTASDGKNKGKLKHFQEAIKILKEINRSDKAIDMAEKDYNLFLKNAQLDE